VRFGFGAAALVGCPPLITHWEDLLVFHQVAKWWSGQGVADIRWYGKDYDFTIRVESKELVTIVESKMLIEIEATNIDGIFNRVTLHNVVAERAWLSE
jgi:hypothetical protein